MVVLHSAQKGRGLDVLHPGPLVHQAQTTERVHRPQRINLQIQSPRDQNRSPSRAQRTSTPTDPGRLSSDAQGWAGDRSEAVAAFAISYRHAESTR